VAGRAAGVTTAALLTVAVGAAAVITNRVRPDRLPCTALSLGAVALAAVAGFLMVPAGPAPANFLLASAAAASTAVVMLRITCCSTVCLSAVAAFAAMSAGATALAVVCHLPVESVGAVLAVLAFGVLTMAPRLSILLAGLSPEADGHREGQLVLGHRTLTGLVAGGSGSAALAAALVVVGCLHTDAPWHSGAALITVTGMALALRTRTDAGTHRRIVLITSAMLCGSAAFVLVVASAPGCVHWLSAVVVAAGLAAARPPRALNPSPVARRSVDTLEYLALAAVVPLACWVADVYGLARSVSLL
jgi:type VII secretion integral membrane protein EccD